MTKQEGKAAMLLLPRALGAVKLSTETHIANDAMWAGMARSVLKSLSFRRSGEVGFGRGLVSCGNYRSQGSPDTKAASGNCCYLEGMAAVVRGSSSAGSLLPALVVSEDVLTQSRMVVHLRPSPRHRAAVTISACMLRCIIPSAALPSSASMGATASYGTQIAKWRT
jgi:hypothetical protein